MQPRKVYRQVPNFNLIPLEYQKPTISRRQLSLRLVLSLVILAEVIWLTNFYQEKSALESAINSAQQKIQQIDAKLNLVNARETVRQERQTLEAEWKELTMKQADWPQVLSALFQSKPGGVKLASVRQAGKQVSATGIASDYATLLEYRRVLLASPAIAQIVSLESRKEGAAISFSLIIGTKGGGSEG